MAQGAKPKRRKKIPQDHYDTVANMLMNVLPNHMILSQCSMRWNKPKAYVQDVIVRVHEDWATQAAMTADTRRHQIRQGFEVLLMKALKGHPNAQGGQSSPGDLHLASRIMRELGLLDGCYKPATSEINITHGGQVGMGIALGALGFKSQDEVRDRIDELRAQLAKQGPAALQAPQGSGTPAATDAHVPTAATSGFIDVEEGD
jgi:hypothetical protein